MRTAVSFWDLLKDFEIEIPMIQRDYAQGRQTAHASEIRTTMVSDVFEALESAKGTTINFDFIYGREKEVEGGVALIPIDGQQRLTTLFLLHWYLAQKDGKAADAHARLARFRYSTRPSSGEFCSALVNENVDLTTSAPRISEQLTDASWFVSSWAKDPTVSGMLVMLDAIDERFRHTSGLFEVLTDSEKPPLVMQFAQMGSLHLDDTIYVKMNARGKPLTEFESFKADFSKYLKDRWPQKQSSFVIQVDQKWTDAFWDFRVKDVVDEPFMRFFEYAAEIRYYRKQTSSDSKTFEKLKQERGYWKHVFVEEEDVEWLFRSLDFLADYPLREILSSVFVETDHGSPPVSLFESDVDLFARCVKSERFQIIHRVLLALIIEYLQYSPHRDDLDELRDRLRVFRNLLLRVRTFRWPRFSSELGTDDLWKYYADALAFAHLDSRVYEALAEGLQFVSFTRESVEQERVKGRGLVQGVLTRKQLAAVEDDPLFQGTVHALIDDGSLANLSEHFRILKELLDANDNGSLVRALLTMRNESGYIFQGVRLPNWSSIGYRWYYGSPKNWHGFLTYDAASIGESLRALIRSYTEARTGNTSTTARVFLEDCRLNWLNSHTITEGFRYYFIKYKSFLSDDSNMFAKYDESDNYEIEHIFTYMVTGYHINAYVEAVASIESLGEFIDHDECWTKGHSHKPLELVDGLQLWSGEEGWKVVSGSSILDDLSGIRRVETDEGTAYYLEQGPTEDRIEVAEKFIRTRFGGENR